MTTSDSTAANPAPDAPGWFRANCAVAPETGTTLTDGRALRWLRWGDAGAPPLVLVHGGGANARWWAPLAPFFLPDHCVVAPDLSGMGDSDWLTDGYGTEQWADEVMAVAADACPAAPVPPVLVGHSLGAGVVAAAALRHPDRIGGVVLCDLGGQRRGDRDRSSRLFQNRIVYPSRDDAIERFKLIPRQPCTNEWYVEHIARHSVRPVGPGGPSDPTRPSPTEATAWAWKFDWRLFARTDQHPLSVTLPQLGRASCPVASIYGEHSRVVPAERARRLDELLGGRPSVTIPDARHHLMVDQPIAFVTALRTLLATW
ncbi:MAG: alpha/beta fold hydrolase [Acidimicrobiia bacterium]